MASKARRTVLFNSLYFLLFLCVVLVIHHGILRSFDARKLFLLAASWFFYATWSPQFLLLLITTTWVDFRLALAIARAGPGPRARRLLTLSLVLNLGLLGYFKYAFFFYESASFLWPLPPAPGFLSVVVPLGISFYTFHSISYVIDTYRGIRPPTESFRDFALYVAFFPQLVAGPITRWGFFGPQLASPPHVGLARIDGALFLLAVGYVKKVVCADSLGAYVDEVYRDVALMGSLDLLIALYAYAFQIYFDFSGYTDIAMGAAGLLGFRLPENFRHPYLAENPSEFWRRWHISLSTWLRDYLYIPLGGNRRGDARTYLNLMITMLLGGLWHGAAWTFVLWGSFHGAWLAVHRALSGRNWWRPRGDAAPPARTPRWLRRAVTFHLVALAWVPFRAGSLADTVTYLERLVSFRPLADPLPLGTIAIILAGFATHGLALRLELDTLWQRIPRPLQGAAYALVIIAIGIFSVRSERFIYFQF